MKDSAKHLWVRLGAWQAYESIQEEKIEGEIKKITNYKIQNTNKSQTTNHKSQKEEVPCGPIVYACGEIFATESTENVGFKSTK